MTNNVQIALIHAASPQRIWHKELSIPANSSVAQAVELSGFYQDFPEMKAVTPVVGIYGKVCTPERCVSEGDRIEIYRPLRFDPMESRRRRAEHKRKQQLRAAKA